MNTVDNSPSFKRRTVLGAAISVLFVAGKTFAADSSAGKAMLAMAPIAKKEPVTDTYWGMQIVDPYRWMEQKPASAEWTTWLKEQNNYTQVALEALPAKASFMKSLETYTKAVDTLGFIQSAGDKLFISKRVIGSQVIALFVRDGGGKERLLFDPSAGVEAGKPTRTMDYAMPSPSGDYVAYGVSEGGSEMTASYILNVSTGETTEVSRIFSRGTGWTGDGKGFFYYRLRADAVPGTLEFGKGGSCWLHRIDQAGKQAGKDVELFRSGEGPGFEEIEDDQPHLASAPHSKWVLASHVCNGNEIASLYVCRYDDLLKGSPAWRKVANRKDGVLQAKLVGDDIYVLANGRADRGEIYKFTAQNGKIDATTKVISQGSFVINEFVTTKDGVYVRTFEHGVSGLIRLSAKGKLDKIIMPIQGSVWSMASNPDHTGLWYLIDDLTTPATSYYLDGKMLTSTSVELVKAPPYSTKNFLTTSTSVSVRDGTKVPVEILSRKDTQRDGHRPVLLIAYGSYGSILDPGYNSSMLSLLDAGGLVVYAHVRGGGELGDDWHRAGQKATKPNTWRDAIDVAEFLIKEKWTSKQQVALWGTSAGGIMVGRAMTERPDLFGAAIGEVGAFNTLRFELTSNGPGNDAEFGTVKKEDEFHALLAMDSYHAVRDGVKYPATLLLTGANDLRIEPWQIGKFAARLQEANAASTPILLRVDYDSGHFATNRKYAMEKYADIFSFVVNYCNTARARS